MAAQPATLENTWKRPFFTIWGVQALSWFGSALVQFALIWWLTEASGSATVLATAALVGMLPSVVLGPFVGACVDRWNRRTVMIVSDSIVALATLALAVIYGAGQIAFWHVYVLLFVRATAGSFHWYSMQASTSLMVPEAQLGRVAGLNQTLRGLTDILMPPLGAVLLAVMPMFGILAIDVVTALIGVTPLLFIAIPQPVRNGQAAGQRAGSILHDLWEGVRYVRAWAALMIMLGMAMLINFLLNPAFSLLPIYVTKHLGGQAMQLAWINSALGIGAVLGGLTLSSWGGFKRQMYTAMLGLAGLGVGSLLIGLTPANWLIMALLGAFVAGFMNPICNGPLLAVIQSTVEPEMQGRVLSLMTSAAGAISPLGLIIAGPVADHLSVSLWYLAGGLICVAMAIGSLFVPALMRMEKGRDGSPTAATADPQLARTE